MARTTTTVEDPELVTKKTVDSNGRLYLGTDYKSKDVRVVVEVLKGDEPEPDESAFARELSRRSIANHEDDYFDKNPDWADDLPDLGEDS